MEFNTVTHTVLAITNSLIFHDVHIVKDSHFSSNNSYTLGLYFTNIYIIHYENCYTIDSKNKYRNDIF